MTISKECLEFQSKFEDYVEKGILPQGFSNVESIQDYMRKFSKDERKNIRTVSDINLKAQNDYYFTAPMLNILPRAIAEGLGCGAILGTAAYKASESRLTGLTIGASSTLGWIYNRCQNAKKAKQNEYAAYKDRLAQFDEVLPKSSYGY